MHGLRGAIPAKWDNPWGKRQKTLVNIGWSGWFESHLEHHFEMAAPKGKPQAQQSHLEHQYYRSVNTTGLFFCSVGLWQLLRVLCLFYWGVFLFRAAHLFPIMELLRRV